LQPRAFLQRGVLTFSVVCSFDQLLALCEARVSDGKVELKTADVAQVLELALRLQSARFVRASVLPDVGSLGCVCAVQLVATSTSAPLRYV
jgi:hypothetical protein